MLKRNSISIGLLSLVVVFAFANPVASQQSIKSADVKKSAETERAAEAADVLTQITSLFSALQEQLGWGRTYIDRFYDIRSFLRASDLLIFEVLPSTFVRSTRLPSGDIE